MAAVLAAGPDGVLSHRDGAAALGIRPTSRATIDVTVRRKLHRRDGLDFHYAVLPPDEVTTERDIPVTTVPRTIFDLAAVTSHREVERAMHEAEVRRLYDELSLRDLLARYPRARGSRTIRAILASGEEGPRTRNDFEEAFLAFVDRFRLPRPRMNEWLCIAGRWIEADSVWHAQRLIVELDGRETHHTLKAFESDRARDRALHVAGWRVIRVTWRQLHQHPEELAADLRALLART